MDARLSGNVEQAGLDDPGLNPEGRGQYREKVSRV